MTDISTLYPHICFRKNWTIDSDTMYMLGQCEAVIRMISNTPIKPKYRRELLHASLQKGAQATTAIEGNTLSDEEVARIAQGASLPPSKEYLQKEVKNMLDAFNGIRNEVILGGNSIIITPELIRNFNGIVGRDLGNHFIAAPGAFRASGHNVIVGLYRPPLGEHVAGLVVKFCDWLRKEFHYEDGDQGFAEQVIQSIVSHVYIAWIHPFGDGNGRTARMLEFYILLRAGLPDIASHILSNYYNNTREEYYRQLARATEERDLTDFIKYAILGFRDGLNEVLDVIQKNLLETSWQNFIYDSLDSKKASGKAKNVIKRRRNLALRFPTDQYYRIAELLENNPHIFKEYLKLAPATLKRDLDELEKLEIVVKKGRRYIGNIAVLKRLMPLKKETENI